MVRLIFLATFVLMVVAATLGLKTCHDGSEVTEQIDSKVLPEITMLKDGTPLFAPDGTVGRQLADWLESEDHRGRFFELGGLQFVGRALDPTPEALGRLTRLIKMLRAYPDVRAKVIGFTSSTGNAAADRSLTVERARRVVERLKDAGIPEDRLKWEGRGAADPLSRDARPAAKARNERIGIYLGDEER